MWNYLTMIDDVCREQRRAERVDTMMSAKAWTNNHYGSAEVAHSSFDTIFSAYRDYRNSQQWN